MIGKNNIDPPPSEFDYPPTNFKSNQFKKLKGDYDFYKTIIIIIILISSLVQLLTLLKIVFSRNIFNIKTKKTKIKIFDKINLKMMFFFTFLLIVFLLTLCFYKVEHPNITA